MASVFLFIFFLLSHLLHLHLAQEQPPGSNPSCQPFYCAQLGGISFPFYNKLNPECGIYPIDNCETPNSKPRIQLVDQGRWYDIQVISDAQTVHINDTLLQNQIISKNCSVLNDLSLPEPSLVSYIETTNLTLYKCSQTSETMPPDFTYINCAGYEFYYDLSNVGGTLRNLPQLCSGIRVPINKNTTKSNDLFAVLTANFEFAVHPTDRCAQCYLRGGECQIQGQDKFHCTKGDKGNSRQKVVIAGTVAGVGIPMAIICCLIIKFATDKYKKKTQNQQNIEAFLKNQGPFAIKRYSYSEIQKMTNSFKDKLGQGGYGGVYKAKLHDGSLVAVKVLNESKGTGEEFINEVATICRTSHVNVVSLLGFCFEGRKRALIYEFMPNGSLEKYIYNNRPGNEGHRQLECETLYQISLGIARGLEYLHRGCNTRILHFDIKPHNILLDEDFCPKISDFGLAKICSKKESIVSMMVARGTPGYIAPEVFCKNFGGVSHKSDVYSYGMMVFEIVSGRKNSEVNGETCTSESYFPQWIYKRIELEEDFELPCIMNEKDKEVMRKMVIVSLWCIQNDPSNRPPMHKVVEMLEGSLQALQIPPKPFLSSPTRSPMYTTFSTWESLQ